MARTINIPAVCSFCGLPIPGATWGAGIFSGKTAHRIADPLIEEDPQPRRLVGSLGTESRATEGSAPQYCCAGCRLADAILRERAATGSHQRTLIRLGLAVFFSMNVMVFSMALWSRDVYTTGIDSSSADAWHELFRYASLLFSVPVVLLLGGPLLESAWDGLRRRQITSDLLLMVGVLVSLGYSVVSLGRQQPHIYFEVTCAILVAVTIGRWLEAMGRYRASHALESLQSLFPEHARVVIGDHEQSVPLPKVDPGTRVRVLPGERIPVDGIVEGRPGTVDEQIITGESLPVEKLSGERVWGGSLNLYGDLLLRTTAHVHDGAIARMLRAMQQALRERGPYQQLADRITTWFVPWVALIAIAALIAHLPSRGLGGALMVSLAVVLIACPCALAFAIPLAGWVAASAAIRRGVFFRSGDALTLLARTDLVCFDKTGTLTEGTIAYHREFLDSETDAEELYGVARQLSQRSTHPLAMALFHQIPARDDDLREELAVEQFPGRGVLGYDTERRMFLLGSLRFAQEHGLVAPPNLTWDALPTTTRQQSLLWIGWDGRIRGLFEFAESIRPSARMAIDELRSMQIPCRMLTGDHRERAAVIAKELALSADAELLPDEKLARLRAFRDEGRHVVMVGDGVNDAPALAAADVGIALGAGAAVSRDAAGVCLLNSDLTAIPWSLRLARRCVQVMRRNLFWAFGYNCVGIGLAAAGWLNPIVAAIAMIGSSLFVIVESLRLGREFMDDESLVMSDSNWPIRTDKPPLRPLPQLQELAS